MNLLRFRLLPRQRSLKPNDLAMRLGGAVLAIAFFSASAFATDSDDALSKRKDECKKLGKEKDSKISIYVEEGKVLKDDFNPRLQCKANAGEESYSHNSLATVTPNDLAKSRPNFLATMSQLHKDKGACIAAYDAMKDIYDHLTQLKSTFCEDYAEVRQKADSCGNGVFEKKCEPEWTRVKEADIRWLTQLKEKATPIGKYLKDLETAVRTARDHYEADHKKMEATFSSPSVTVASRGSITAIADAPDIKASNGNKFSATRSLADYFDLINGVPDWTKGSRKTLPVAQYSPTGPLIKEQTKATEALVKFTNIYKEQMNVERVLAENEVTQITNGLQNSDKLGTIKDGHNWTGKINSVTPALTSGMPLAQQMLGPKGAAQAGLNLAGGSSPAPLAALAAAGAVGAIAARSLGSSGASSPSLGGAEAALPAVPGAPAANTPGAEVAKFGDHAEGKADKISAPGSDAPTAPKKDDGVVAIEGTVAGGGAADLNEGSSRTLSGAKKNGQAGTSAPAPGGAVDAGGAGTSDGMPNFNQNLAPKATPAASTQSPGSEVANLLGQMKNLFNFEEGGPMAGPQSASNPPASPGMDPYATEGAPADAGAQPLPEEEAAAAEETVPQHFDNPFEQSHDTRGSLFGKVDTSLFSRVRARHHRCMERGLVLYGLKERVE